MKCIFGQLRPLWTTIGKVSLLDLQLLFYGVLCHCLGQHFQQIVCKGYCMFPSCVICINNLFCLLCSAVAQRYCHSLTLSSLPGVPRSKTEHIKMEIVKNLYPAEESDTERSLFQSLCNPQSLLGALYSIYHKLQHVNAIGS